MGRDRTVRERAHKHIPSGWVAWDHVKSSNTRLQKNAWPLRLMDSASAVVVFFLQHDTQGCMAMITCSRATTGSGWGYSLNIRINDHAGRSSETSFMVVLRFNAMQTNNGNAGNIVGL